MKFTPFRITILYLIFAILWISTTDQILEWFVDDIELLSTLQTVKGLFYVFLTGGLLYLMTKSYETFITQRKANQKKKDEVFTNALNTSNVAIWEFNIQNGEFLISDNHNNMLGLPPDKALRMDNILSNVHPDDRELVDKTVKSALQNGTDINIEYRVLHENEEVRWLWSKGRTSVRNGNTQTIQGVLTDITEIKELESELSREQELQNKILEHIPVMITVYNPKISEFEVNNEFKLVTGWSDEDMADPETISKIYPDVQYRDEVFEFMANPDGSWKDFEMVSSTGKKIQSTWTNIRLSDDTQIGIGLDITERKNREREIEQHRNELQKIYKNIPVMITIQDSEQNIIDANEFFIEKTGYTKQEIKNKNVLEKIIPSENLDSAIDHMRVSDQGWKDFNLVAKNGEQVFSSWTNTVVSEDRVIGLGIDLTERRQIEQELREKEERLSLTTKSANVGLWEWNPQTGETMFDEIWAGLVGYTLEELQPISIDTWNKLVHPKDLKKFENVVNQYFAGKIPIYECEIRMKHKEGHWVWILDRGQTVEWDEDGNPTRVVGTHVDITDRVHFEHENRLLAEVFLSSNTGLAVSNHQTNKLERVNSAFYELFSYEFEEMIGMDIDEIFADESSYNSEKIQQKLSDKKEVTFEAKFQKKDKSTFWGLINLVIINDKETDNSYKICTIQDISEIKRREEWIKKLTDNVPGAIFNYKLNNDGTDELTYMSSGCKEVWGVSSSDALDDLSLLWNRIHPDDLEEMRDSILESAKKMERWDHTWRIVKGKDNLIWVNGFGQPEKMMDGSILWHSFIQDITFRKQQEEELKQSRDRLLQAQEIANLGYWTYRPADKSIWWSEIVYDIYNWDSSDSEMNLNDYLRLTHPDDREYVRKAFETGLKEKGFRLTHRILKSGSEIGYVQVRGEKLYDEILEEIVLNGTILDITDIKTIEKELEDQQVRFEIAANITTDVIWEWNPRTKTLWWGDGIESVFGFEKEEYAGKPDFWRNHLHPDDRERVTNSMTSAENSRSDIWRDEYRFLAADKSVREIEDRAMLIRDKKGNLNRVIGAMVDVTDKKEAEKQLKASEEQYRLLFEQNPIPMFIYDPETNKITTCNNSAIETYKYSREEFLNMSIFKLSPKSELENAIQQSKRDRKKEETTFGEWTHVTKDGEKLTVEISASHITYQGRKQRLIIANDITEQRLAEERAISAVVEGEDRERRRVAKELHDGLGQYLSAANMNLLSVYEDMPDQDNRFAKTFKTGLDLLHHAISETRTISQNLLPKAIQDYGLELAAESLINQLKNSNEISFYLYQNIKGIDIPEKIQINLYRILQESLNNAIRHGKPKNIEVQLVHSEDELLLVVEDNGIGFDVNNIKNEGLGLRSIKTRVGAMSGNLDIVSTPNKGTIISVVVPI